MKSGIIITLSAFILIVSCQTTSSTHTPKNKKGMIKVTLLYPNDTGKTFDMDYYSEKHMPMVADILGEALKFYEIDKGMAGRTPDDPVPHLAIGYLYFDRLSDYQEAFGLNAEKIVGDIPNYTNIQPVVQISEVLK